MVALMDREQIEKWAREASEHAGHICGEVDPTPSVRQFWSVRDEHFARNVRRAALLEVHTRIDQIDDGEQPAYRHVQEEIRAMLIEKEPQP